MSCLAGDWGRGYDGRVEMVEKEERWEKREVVILFPETYLAAWVSYLSCSLVYFSFSILLDEGFQVRYLAPTVL